jgi:hypothetical protein
MVVEIQIEQSAVHIEQHGIDVVPIEERRRGIHSRYGKAHDGAPQNTERDLHILIKNKLIKNA